MQVKNIQEAVVQVHFTMKGTITLKEEDEHHSVCHHRYLFILVTNLNASGQATDSLLLCYQ